VGFLALGVAFAIQVGLSYLSLSATVNHQNLREVATLIGMWGFGGKILEVAGLVLVAVAVFQRRPAEH
jgi:hypothetical protein